MNKDLDYYYGDIDFNAILRQNETKSMRLRRIPSSIKVSVGTRETLKSMKFNNQESYEKVVFDIIEENKYLKGLL